MLPIQPGSKNTTKAHAVKEMYTPTSSYQCRMDPQLAEAVMGFCTLFLSQELFPQNSDFSCRQQMDLAIEISFLLLTINPQLLYCLLILIKCSTLRNTDLIYFIYVQHVCIQHLFLKVQLLLESKFLFLVNKKETRKGKDSSIDYAIPHTSGVPA